MPHYEALFHRSQRYGAVGSPRHDQEEAVETISVCHLVFVSLEGFQVFNLETDRQKERLQHFKVEPSTHRRNLNASEKPLQCKT